MSKFRVVPLLVILIALLTASACGPSTETIRATVVAEITQMAEVYVAGSEDQIKDPTSRPIRTSTPSPTDTPVPSPTPLPQVGTFENPAHVGDKVHVLVNMGGADFEANYELLEIALGDQVSKIPSSEIGYVHPPIEGQSLIAVRMRIETVLGVGPDTVTSIIPALDVSLRRDPKSPDIWASNLLAQWAEGYEPLTGEGWLVFAARDDMEYYLYVHPFQYALSDVQHMDGGSYFALSDS